MNRSYRNDSFKLGNYTKHLIYDQQTILMCQAEFWMNHFEQFMQ